MTAINSSETKATSVLCIRFRVSDIILVAYQVMDHWAKNRSDHKNKQDNGPESCFIKKKSLIFGIYTFCPNMLPVFISEFIRTKSRHLLTIYMALCPVQSTS